MEATLSIHLTKVSLSPSSFTVVPLGLYSLYFLSLETQRPTQHFIRDSFPQSALPAFSSTDTHLTLAYVQKVINGKKVKNEQTNLCFWPKTTNALPIILIKAFRNLMTCPSFFFMHVCSHRDKKGTFHMMSDELVHTHTKRGIR